MTAGLYPISFLVCLGALSGWFFYRDDEKRSDLLRKIFFGAIAVYGASWAFGQGTVGYKFLVLGREMLVLLTVPLFLSVFRKNKWVFVTLLISVLVGMDYFYFEKLKLTFPQEKTIDLADEVALDSNGEMLIELLEGHSISEIQPILTQYDLQATPAFQPMDKNSTDLDDYFLINVPPRFENDLSEVKNALSKNGVVEWVEMNEQYALSPLEFVPQKKLPKLNKKYGLNDPGLPNLWGFEAMGMESLYAVLKNAAPEKQALIAILDTGVDAGHEDIQANFKSTKTKYDNDGAGHGTHCAGIAAAVSNNNKGIASFSQTNEYVKVTSVKVLTAGGYGTQKMIIDGILEAADAGADVLSLSLGGLSNDSRQRAYRKAVEYANKKGAIVVVAAGNSNRNAKEYAPANTPGVIAVSAIDTVLGRASFSNKVHDLKMGVAAPGVSIYSTFPNGEYQTLNGTSMATPYVAGLLGLMKSLRPGLTTKEAYDLLNGSGVKTKSGEETGKLIQPGEAVKKLLNGG